MPTLADRIVTIVLISFLSVYPILVLLYIAVFSQRVSSETAERFESLNEIVRQDRGKAPLMNVFVFLLRRVIVASTLMLLS